MIEGNARWGSDRGDLRYNYLLQVSKNGIKCLFTEFMSCIQKYFHQQPSWFILGFTEIPVSQLRLVGQMTTSLLLFCSAVIMNVAVSGWTSIIASQHLMHRRVVPLHLKLIWTFGSIIMLPLVYHHADTSTCLGLFRDADLVVGEPHKVFIKIFMLAW